MNFDYQILFLVHVSALYTEYCKKNQHLIKPLMTIMKIRVNIKKCIESVHLSKYLSSCELHSVFFKFILWFWYAAGIKILRIISSFFRAKIHYNLLLLNIFYLNGKEILYQVNSNIKTFFVVKIAPLLVLSCTIKFVG